MHEILELIGRLEGKKRKGLFGSPSMPKGAIIKSEDIYSLVEQLENLKFFWLNQKIVSFALITVYYNKIVAKSNRIKKILSTKNKSPNDMIVGAKFVDNKHVITYKIQKVDLDLIINRIKEVLRIIENQFNGEIDNFQLQKINKKEICIDSPIMKRNEFALSVVDLCFINKFDINNLDMDGKKESRIVTFFDIGKELNTILGNIGINLSELSSLNDYTYRMDDNEYQLLASKVPYLIAMEMPDLARYSLSDDANEIMEKVSSMPQPTNEPIVGVIDTLFSEGVYFDEWVEPNNNIISKEIIQKEDYTHGTEVCSLIVNGHVMNPLFDDGCGYFRVRHFGVATSSKFSSFEIVKNIKKIVETNRDIIVWNLSLGSDREINENFISFEGAVLDELQNQYGIIFVVAGTNNNNGSVKIGAPADSINSIVVNSVKTDGTPASYSRRGPVLSFFNKPDICCFGGDGYEVIRVCNANGERLVAGTSYAAPWITRKMAYLIHKLGMSREIAKALIIDSATNWENANSNPLLCGYGVVPQRIEDIISTKDDEIKFFISGFAEKYDTYNYKIPVPISKGKHPFISKATMCYFPHCSRNQGVDYTDVELDLHFGRIKITKGVPEICSINDNKQGIPNIYGGNEEDARKEYRKWDNVKHICERQKTRKIPKDAIENGFWGLSIKKVSRLSTTNLEAIPFGVVITLKDIYGDDHFEEFIQQCNFRGWIVNRINVEEKISLFNKIEEDIELE